MARAKPGGYILAMVSAVLVSAAQLCLKLGMSQVPEPGLWGGTPGWSAIGLEPLIWILSGLACYGSSMILWIGVLSRLPLSAAYPLLSISYVLVYLVATSFPAWGELASGRRTAGILLIMLGVGLVSLPARRSDA
jgi:undecaprenyl phosphate-alpha-L-ara4N flippase subunit ArnF